MAWIVEIDKRAEKELAKMDRPDAPTHADVTGLFDAVGYRPQVSVDKGVERFVDW